MMMMFGVMMMIFVWLTTMANKQVEVVGAARRGEGGETLKLQADRLEESAAAVAAV